MTTSASASEERVHDLMRASHEMLNEAVDSIRKVKDLVGIVGLFSGGNDSTTLCHLFKDRVTHFAHANTGIGIEQTRQYVRDTCQEWGIPLLERGPLEGETYEDLVLGQCKPKTARAKNPVVWPGGFPGPGTHGMMFQRLKERPLHQIRSELVKRPRYERVIFLAGRRKEESARRTARFKSGQIVPIETRGSIVWVSPLLDWTKADLAQYRKMFDVPRNEVSDALHMSGECLCGCFTHPGEIEEIRFWYPEVAAAIEDLERRVRERGLDIPEKTCKWGWNSRGACASGLCNN